MVLHYLRNQCSSITPILVSAILMVLFHFVLSSRHKSPDPKKVTTQLKSFLKSCPSAYSVISGICEQPAQSCRDNCLLKPGKSGRTCGCDPLCRIYGDCCHDFEQFCFQASLDDHNNSHLKEVHTTCLDSGQRVITGCGEKNGDIMNIDICTIFPLGVHYLNQEVMEYCNPSSVLTCAKWERSILGRSELSVDHVARILEEQKHNKPQWIINLGLSLTSRQCSPPFTLDTQCNTQIEGCHDFTIDDLNLVCKISIDQKDNWGTANDSFMTRQGLAPSSNFTQNCHLVDERHEPLEKVLYYAFGEKRAGFWDIFRISSKYSPHRFYFWSEILCFEYNRKEGRIYSGEKETNRNISCVISKCFPGYFYVSEHCYEPKLLTVTISTYTTNDHSMNGYVRLTKKALSVQKTFALTPLGNRLEKDTSDRFVYNDHFSIKRVLVNENDKILSVSKIIYSLAKRAISPSLSYPNITVCIHFPVTTPFLSRCDVISFERIESNLEKYTIITDDKRFFVRSGNDVLLEESNYLKMVIPNFQSEDKNIAAVVGSSRLLFLIIFLYKLT